MFLHHVMKHVVGKEPVLMIDMCAAPGGKSTLACSLLPEGSMIVSNEPVAQRASILSENMKKWGMPNVVVTNNYPRDIRKTGITADIVLCDVPCSGEGMFRKDEATIGEWSMKNVEKCSAMQREIVSEAWQCLRQGGIMIYSTCTFNTRENEENVRWISESMDGEIIEIPTEKEWGITGSLLPGFDEPVYRFIPGRTRGEGLFMCGDTKERRMHTEDAKDESERQGKEQHGMAEEPRDVCRGTEWTEHYGNAESMATNSEASRKGVESGARGHKSRHGEGQGHNTRPVSCTLDRTQKRCLP